MPVTLRQYILGAGALLFLGAGHRALAAPQPKPWEATPPPAIVEERMRLDVGLWRPSINTYIRADATATQPGTVLDGENDVGLQDSATMLDLELTLLPGKRHLVRLHGFTSRRDGDTILTRTVQYDGNTYNVGSRVKSLLNLDMLGVGYAYRLIKHPRLEWDVGADIELTSAEVNVDTLPYTGAPRQSDSGRAPIPLFDTEVRWRVWRDFQLDGRYRWLDVNVDNGNKKGSITSSRFGLAWQMNPHLNIGLYQRRFSISVDLATGSNPGALRLNYKGWELGVRASL